MQKFSNLVQGKHHQAGVELT